MNAIANRLQSLGQSPGQSPGQNPGPSRLGAEIDEKGYALTGPLLTARDCARLRRGYGDDARYRSTIAMARYGFGQGEYRYFAYPLPDLVADLRRAAWPLLAEIANRWAAALGQERRYPDNLDEYLAHCHDAGQTRPTPLILRYGPGDYNCLHQDLYGDEVFPLQIAILLSAPGAAVEGGDFEGGEFVLTEQRPRRQSRASVVPLKRGEGVIFPVNERPVEGSRGAYRVKMRHGVSEVRTGERFTLGIIFHDAA